MPNRYNNLIEQINLRKPKSILEIGTWNGVHAEQMIRAALAHRNKVYYWGFDLFEDFKLAGTEFCPKLPAKLEAVKLKLSHIKHAEINLIKGNTRETLKKYLPTVDFIFIDGGHSIKTIESDWHNIQKSIYVNTIVIFDDYYKDTISVGCKTLIDTLVHDNNWLVKFLEPVDKIDGLEISMVKVWPSFTL